MNDSNKSSNGLLVLKVPKHIGMEAVEKLTRDIAPLAEDMGLEPMVLDGGADAHVSVDYTPLLTRLCVAVERLVAQGEVPEGLGQNVAENAPQALNARPSSLNSRPKADPSLEGVTHGTDFPPISKDGTWLLEKGEQVVLSSDRSGQTEGRVRPDASWRRSTDRG